MSIDRMQAVWGGGNYPGSKHTGLARFLLVAIADNASDDGFAWPGISYLHKKTSISERHISRLIKQLHNSGELWVEQHHEEGNRTFYIVTIGLNDKAIIGTLTDRASKSLEEARKILAEIRKRLRGDDTTSPPQKSGDDTTSPLGMTPRHGGDDTMLPEPSCNPHFEPSTLTDSDNFMLSNESKPKKEFGKSQIRVDVDDSGNEMPDEWSFENDDLLRYCGNSTKPKRKTFASAKEKRRWQKIRQWATEDQDAYRWAIDRADRAQKKGWKFPGLLNAIENKVNFEDWKAGSLEEDNQPLSRQTEEIDWEEYEIEFPTGV
jgi:hypothetical protein